MKTLTAAFVCGGIFAAGLILSGMTQPDKVMGFLDIFGAWDPTLAFVMIGAIGIHAPTRRWIGSRARPILTNQFHDLKPRHIDRNLLLGAALFGIGWGLAGFCPGPAVASITSPSHNATPFVLSMIVGMTLHQWLSRRLTSVKEDEK
jgi:uncharacterized membrane protein YedE/YeeE